MLQISSLNNPKVKTLIKLEKSGHRAEMGLFTVEGKKEILLCAEAGYEITELYFCPDIVKDASLVESPLFKSTQLIEITQPVFEKLAYRESRDGYFAVAKINYKKLDELQLSKTPLIVILEAVEKPGNLGAILRSADAADVDAVIVCDKKTDIFNPNAIRSSLGCIFTNQVVCCSNEECLTWLKEKGMLTYAAALTATEFYHEQNFKQPTALVFGTEAAGLSDFWLRKASKQIKIPMRGKIDSLNVSGSCAIITFEAMRQRGFGSH
jgi:TrmH family RNA methyltransferase